MASFKNDSPYAPINCHNHHPEFCLESGATSESIDPIHRALLGRGPPGPAWAHLGLPGPRAFPGFKPGSAAEPPGMKALSTLCHGFYPGPTKAASSFLICSPGQRAPQHQGLAGQPCGVLSSPVGAGRPMGS